MSRRLAPLIAVTACLVVCMGCAHRYGLDRQRAGGSLPGSVTVYVALPEPGSFAGTEYAESGAQTQAAIVAAVDPHVASVSMGDTVEDYAAALNSARTRGVSHAVVPRIKHWEERATEWSGKPDRIIINIQIVDVSSGSVVDAAEVSGTSRWGTLGGDHPEELLPRAVGDYFAGLFP